MVSSLSLDSLLPLYYPLRLGVPVSGIFASQFNPVSPYDPVGLDTGTPKVGMTLGKKTPKRPPSEDTPSRVPPGGGTAAGAEAAAATGGYLHATASAANQASVNANSNMSLVQAGQASHMSAANEAANGIGYHPDAAPATHIVMPKHSGADATPPKQNNNSGGGLLGWVEHTASSVAHNPVVSGIMHFGDPFKTTGIAGAVSPAPPASSVIKPTNVYGPSRSTAGELGPSAPKTIQGQVLGPEGVANGAGQRALPSAYTSQQDFIDMMRGSGAGNLNSTQFGGAKPWYDMIPDDISSIGEDALSAL
jgi:hypothetical protein